jgi:Na+/proline symporter
MESFRAGLVVAIIAMYLASCVGIGTWAIKRTGSTQDFFVAGRKLGVFLTAFAVFSSTMSGFGFVGGPGLVYSMGASSFWIIGSAVVGNVIAFALVAKRLRLLAELRQCVSLPDAIAVRYGSPSVSVSVSVAILLGVLGYLATQILAMAIVLQGILREANVFPTMSLAMAVLVSSSVLVFYAVSGGIIASVYTDLVQGAVMIVAALLVFATVLSVFDGGMSEMSRIVMTDDREAMGPWGTIGMFGSLTWFFVFGVGLAGQPHVITKAMMVRRVRDLRLILPLSAVAYSITALLWIGIGLAMRALVLSGAEPALATPDAAAPTFLQTYAHPLLAAVVFAALLAAIMSTADAFLNIGTAAVIHDIPTAIRGRPLPNELFWARVTTVGLAFVAALFALYTGDLVALLGAFGWGTFAAALVPVIGIGLNWKRATPLAANAAVVSSLAINFGVKLFGVQLPYGVDVGALSLIVSLILFVGLSLLTAPRPLDPGVDAVMDM